MQNGKNRMQGGRKAMSDEFEKEFGDFLESDAYDQAEEALFSLARAAFQAGWKAAGGDSPPALELLSKPSERSKE